MLVENALTNINPEILIGSFNKSRYEDRVLESAWHFELYRTICICLPSGVYVSPQVGKIFGDEGIVDLYISKYKMGYRTIN